MFEISAILNQHLISFPNTGGMAVSNHALTAIFPVPRKRNLGRRLGDLLKLNLKDLRVKVKGNDETLLMSRFPSD